MARVRRGWDAWNDALSVWATILADGTRLPLPWPRYSSVRPECSSGIMWLHPPLSGWGLEIWPGVMSRPFLVFMRAWYSRGVPARGPLSRFVALAERRARRAATQDPRRVRLGRGCATRF